MAAPKGNQFGRKWNKEDLEELAEDIVEASLKYYSIAGIALSLNMTSEHIYKLASRYKVVSQALDLAKAKLVERAWKYGHIGDGFPNILQKAINVHDKSFRKEESKLTLNYLKKQEKIKANERIREKRELSQQIEDGHGCILDEFDEFLEWKAVQAAKKAHKAKKAGEGKKK